MDAAQLTTDLNELLAMAKLRKAQFSPRMFAAKAQVLIATLEDASQEVPPEVFAALDNDGRRMCLTALLTILGAAALEN